MIDVIGFARLDKDNIAAAQYADEHLPKAIEVLGEEHDVIIRTKLNRGWLAHKPENNDLALDLLITALNSEERKHGQYSNLAQWIRAGVVFFALQDNREEMYQEYKSVLFNRRGAMLVEMPTVSAISRLLASRGRMEECNIWLSVLANQSVEQYERTLKDISMMQNNENN